jgi:hypothetical protein
VVPTEPSAVEVAANKSKAAKSDAEAASAKKTEEEEEERVCRYYYYTCELVLYDCICYLYV